MSEKHSRVHPTANKMQSFHCISALPLQGTSIQKLLCQLAVKISQLEQCSTLWEQNVSLKQTKICATERDSLSLKQPPSKKKDDHIRSIMESLEFQMDIAAVPNNLDTLRQVLRGPKPEPDPDMLSLWCFEDLYYVECGKVKQFYNVIAKRLHRKIVNRNDLFPVNPGYPTITYKEMLQHIQEYGDILMDPHLCAVLGQSVTYRNFLDEISFRLLELDLSDTNNLASVNITDTKGLEDIVQMSSPELMAFVDKRVEKAMKNFKKIQEIEDTREQLKEVTDVHRSVAFEMLEGKVNRVPENPQAFRHFAFRMTGRYPPTERGECVCNRNCICRFYCIPDPYICSCKRFAEAEELRKEQEEIAARRALKGKAPMSSQNTEPKSTMNEREMEKYEEYCQDEILFFNNIPRSGPAMPYNPRHHFPMVDETCPAGPSKAYDQGIEEKSDVGVEASDQFEYDKFLRCSSQTEESEELEELEEFVVPDQVVEESDYYLDYSEDTASSSAEWYLFEATQTPTPIQYAFASVALPDRNENRQSADTVDSSSANFDELRTDFRHLSIIRIVLDVPLEDIGVEDSGSAGVDNVEDEIFENSIMSSPATGTTTPENSIESTLDFPKFSQHGSTGASLPATAQDHNVHNLGLSPLTLLLTSNYTPDTNAIVSHIGNITIANNDDTKNVINSAASAVERVAPATCSTATHPSQVSFQERTWVAAGGDLPLQQRVRVPWELAMPGSQTGVGWATPVLTTNSRPTRSGKRSFRSITKGLRLFVKRAPANTI